MYQRYIQVNEILAKISDMDNNRSWPSELGKSPNQTEVIGLFVAKTTWHNTYVKIFPLVDGFEEMQNWLTGDPNRKPDLEVWGTVKSKYTTGDLMEWITNKNEEQQPKKSKSSSSKSTKNAKGKEKEIGSASGSGAKKGNAKKEVAGKKKDHKKKATTSTRG